MFPTVAVFALQIGAAEMGDYFKYITGVMIVNVVKNVPTNCVFNIAKIAVPARLAWCGLGAVFHVRE